MSPSQAANHPNWKMGRKISIDSATMMNKCLELMEACSYFALPPSAVDIVIHPQSIVHSLVTFEDNSVVAQMAVADMRIPIANALAYPDRIVSGADTLDLCAIGRLDFLHPDEARFPCIAVARDVATIGGTAPAIMNAANEVAVELFCQGKIRFTDIVPMIEKTVSRMPHEPIAGVDHVLEVDQRARAVTRKLLGQKTL
jgi:1-deoxy-D-xylulose-5-phosphate reductoisomerase